MKDDLILTVKELAQELKISLPKAYDLCRRKDFPALKIDKRILILREPYQAWLLAQTNVPSEHAMHLQVGRG